MAWNRPTSNTVDATSSSRSSGRGKMPRLRRGLFAGAIVVLGAGIAAWLLFSREATSSSLQKKDRGLIKEVKPAAAPTNVVPKKPVDPKEDYDHEKFYRDEKGILRWKSSGGRAPDPSKKLRQLKSFYDPEKQPFHHISEKCIHRLITARPGTKIFGRIDYTNPDFLADFQESIKEPIIVSKEEPPEIQRAKRAMIEAKKEICDRLADGENLADILTQTQKELQRLHEYKRSIEDAVDDAVESSGGMSDADLDDYITAANKMLEEKGIAPIHRNAIVDWNIKLRNQKENASPNPERQDK